MEVPDLLVPSAFMAVRMAFTWLRSGRTLRISTDEVAGPTTREHGFTQSSIRVVVANRGSTKVEIHDIRLMFARRFGVPLREAPPPRSHPRLPAAIEPGSAATWYFPAETLAILLGDFSPKFPPSKGHRKLRARVVTAAGAVRRSRRLRFSLDVNSHWL